MSHRQPEAKERVTEKGNGKKDRRAGAVGENSALERSLVRPT